MYGATGGPNVKWVTPISNGGPGTTAPTLATTLNTTYLRFIKTGVTWAMMSLHLTLSYNIQIDNYFFLAVKLIHGTTLAMIVLRAAQYAQLRYA